MARALTIVVALAVGIGGVLPHWTAYRCAMMEAVVAHACCEAPDVAERTLDGDCCAAFEGPVAPVRMTPKALPGFAPPPLAGVVTWISPPLVAAPGFTRLADAAPPPTRKLGTVLRI